MLHYVTIPNFAKSMNYLINPPILHGSRELQRTPKLQRPWIRVARPGYLSSMRLQPQEGIGSKELMRLQIYHISIYIYVYIDTIPEDT